MNNPTSIPTADHHPWPTWKKIIAYAALVALASASIWVIDLKVTPSPPPHPAAAHAH